jgi:uncharacterized protein
MKPSMYNFIWPTDDPEKRIVFNSLTTALIETGRLYMDLLAESQFDYHSLSPGAQQFVDVLIPGGFFLKDETDEQKILKHTYYSNKYNQAALALTIAPTLNCNFTCRYCYERAVNSQLIQKGQHTFMPESVQQGLMKFIDQAAKMVKKVSITWYGGEPLLAQKIIFGLSEKIIEIAEENKLDYSAGMITNGYLLTEGTDLLRKLVNSKINFFQITLDGPPDIHNSRRILKGNLGPTFDRILEGIKLLADHKMDVNLRINIDRSNMNDALRLLDILEVNQLREISIHLGHVRSDEKGFGNQNSGATMEDFTRINKHLYTLLRQRGFKTEHLPHYPGIIEACGANRMNAFVIDPDGDMYKCWEEIGKKSVCIGNIDGFKQFRDRNKWMHEIRWLSWEPFEYSECLACKYLPICMGGCSYRAMFVNGNKPECAEWKYSLEHYIRERYHKEKNITVAGEKA